MILFMLVAVSTTISAADPAPKSAGPLPESWDYAEPMKNAAKRFKGTEGVVIHVGGSMTVANPYGQWPRFGDGKTDDDKAILKWMHIEAKNKTDGWWLCKEEIGDHLTYTAESGLKSAMLFAERKEKLPTLAKLLAEYKPRMVTIECGIYDVESGVSKDEYLKNMAKAIDAILAEGAIPILNTIPPFKAELEKTKKFNEGLRILAKERGIPVIDLEREVFARQPENWYGTLVDRIHMTANVKGVKSTDKPTADNLSKNGYLLRGWLTVQKIAEVKQRVLDSSK